MGFLGNLFKPKAQTDEEAERSAKLLEHLKSRRGAETGKWLAMMQVPGKPQAPAQAGPLPSIEDIDRHEVLDEKPYVPPMEAQYPFLAEAGRADAASPSRGNETVDWVNKLFSEFEQQAEKYNASATGTELILSVHLPEFTFETPHYDAPYDPNKKISIFKGHITTLHWAMLVQGYEDQIDVYIISSDEILNFTLNDIRKSKVSPFLSFSSLIMNGHRIWNVGGEIVTADKLPVLAKELLGDLIRVSAGSMSEAELFADHHVELTLGATVAQGFAPNKKASQAELQVVSLITAETAIPETASPATARPAAKDSARQVSSQAINSADKLKALASWSACDTLLKVIDHDLESLVEQESALTAEQEAEAAKLRDLSAALRTLSGQVADVLSRYRDN